ncbi:glycine-rich domain-containing protein [Ancylobacter defluvii]|uniref:Glycine-rich domain-containing protein n=1 Tax=Ancylobacter defluvii TaxID=1282440 RepID=A0A9W6NCL0_9HYPH|nr:hypothetical protein [Ancylobacter defluvii]MBS7586395.1 hypothetical protein [Ancylobacter defluvii]GLK85676.1 hypothetical protein GCM10017653_37460 [Ancylobacter defluvii]
MDRVNGLDWIDIGGGRRGFRDRNDTAGFPGTEITAAWLNAVQEELATIASLNGAALAAGDFAQVAVGIQSGALNYAAGAGGTATDLTAALYPPVLARKPGMKLRVLATYAPGAGGCSLKVDGLAADELTRPGGAPIQLGDWAAGQCLDIIDLGTRYELTTLGFTGLPSNGVAYIAAGSYPWTAPEGCTRVKASVGGAGGGGGACGIDGGASGGGGGGYGEGIYPVAPGNLYTITVGAGGLGGTLAGNGTNGGTSSFSTRISCTGGRFGYGISSGYQASNAAGGTSTDGFLNLQGARGSNALPAGPGWAGGAGGSCPRLAGTAPYSLGPAWVGGGPGCGGSAGGCFDGVARDGGNGAAGAVFLEW